MKKITAMVVGYGDRAECYCNFAITNPDELEIVAVVDPDPRKLEKAQRLYGVKRECCFALFEDALKPGRIADCIINGTMDQLHYETSLPLLRLGYNMLLEKPVCNNARQLMEIKQAAEENGCFLMVCHVLRYTPFYRKFKQLVSEGAIGEIMHMETNENVYIAHASNSYIRGKWKREDVTGSTMLLAKCCHDLDLICWLNNGTYPVEVASFGGRNFLNFDKAPEHAGTRCLNDCPLVDSCQFSAKALYVENDRFPHYSWETIPKPYHEVTLDEKIRSLKTDNPHGLCAYKTGANTVDHQCLILNFKNGSTAMHSMVLGTALPGRKIHIMGTEGEIEGLLEEGRIFLRKFNKVNAFYTEEEFDINNEINPGDTHAGGDSQLIADFVRTLRGEKASISCTKIDDSIFGHLCVYGADESRLTHSVKKIEI